MKVTTDPTSEAEESPPNRNAQEDTDMNAIVSSLYRDLTCAAAALLISLVIGASFVQSTATAPGAYVQVATAPTASA
jgi:hypothetical protein